MGWPSTLSSWLVRRPIEEDAARLWRLIYNHAEILLLTLGVVVRLEVYFRQRTFTFDEESLWGNIKGMPALDFSHPIRGDQLAPLGFLVALRAMVRALGPAEWVGRLIPLVSGIVAPFLFTPLARLVLPRPAALIALLLFVCSEDLIYYSSIMKPYSLDVAVAVALGLAAVSALGTPFSMRRAAWMAFAAIVAPWFSFPSVFIIAACGSVLIATRILAKDRFAATVWCSVGLAWLASFLASYQAALHLLSPDTTMYAFWNFAFPPIFPLPMSVMRTYKTAGILLEIFVNPLNMVASPWVGIALPILLVVIGGVSLWRRAWPICTILFGPVVLAVIASALRRYPIHGRLILELVPAFFLLFAEGAMLLVSHATGKGKLAGRAVLAVALAQPCVAGLYLLWDDPPRDHNQHGDLHKNQFLYDDVPPISNPTAPSRGQRTGARALDQAGPLSAVHNSGMSTRLPPFIADSWAHRPTIVQFAEVAASGRAGRSPLTALKNACTKCGCDPPWPPPWRNDKCSASWIAAGWVNLRIGSGSRRA
jgi:hypothetical protein